MHLTDIEFLSIREISTAIQNGDATSLAVTEHLLARIARMNPHLQAFCTVTADLARTQAQQADAELAAGRKRGPLHGVPVAVKDLCFTQGIPTSSGMAIFRDWAPDYDATVVTLLREAGAVLLGKLSMTEGAGLMHHPEMPTPRNPWNDALWTGVSSSGSGVAAAAGLCFGALGSDTGGSIRLPSAANNVTGLKTTWGRVSRYGVFPLAESRDTIGPMARSAEDVAILFDAIAGHDANDPTSLTAPNSSALAGLAGAEGARGLRIGIDRTFCTRGVASEVAEATQQAARTMESAGATLVDIAFPDLEPLLTNFRESMLREAAKAHEALYRQHRDRYGPWFGAALEQFMAAPDEPVEERVARETFKEAYLRLFDSVDAVMVPASPIVIPEADKVAAYLQPGPGTLAYFTAFINVAGTPSLTLPCGFSENGTPIGLQLAGPPLAEPLLLRLGHAYQQVTDWHLRHPG